MTSRTKPESMMMMMEAVCAAAVQQLEKDKEWLQSIEIPKFDTPEQAKEWLLKFRDNLQRMKDDVDYVNNILQPVTNVNTHKDGDTG